MKPQNCSTIPHVSSAGQKDTTEELRNVHTVDRTPESTNLFKELNRLDSYFILLPTWQPLHVVRMDPSSLKALTGEKRLPLISVLALKWPLPEVEAKVSLIMWFDAGLEVFIHYCSHVTS